MTWHEMTSQHITSHVANSHINSPQIISQPTTLLQSTSNHKHITSKHMTSKPWNSKRIVHSKEMVWASPWSAAWCTFYRQILSLLYSSFFLLKLPPPARPGTTYNFIHTHIYYLTSTPLTLLLHTVLFQVGFCNLRCLRELLQLNLCARRFGGQSWAKINLKHVLGSTRFLRTVSVKMLQKRNCVWI